MKKVKKVNYVILLIIILSLPFWARAQGYQILPDSNARPIKQKITTTTFQPVIDADSTSWDIAYMELFGIVMEHLFTIKYPDSVYSKLYLIGYYPTEYMGEVYEDTITGKIWYKYPNSDEEKLIMDMSLSVGDTFQITPGVWNAVDSVYFQEGRKIIRFDLQTKWDEPVLFIEGVGPNISLIYPNYDYDGYYAACKYDFDSLVYVNNNPNFINCEPKPVGIPDQPEIDRIYIYPNPASSELNVELPGNPQTNVKLILSDFTGRILKQQQFSGSKQTISLTDLKSGIYLVSITTHPQYHSHLILVTN
jgi:hypothetical protein